MILKFIKHYYWILTKQIQEIEINIPIFIYQEDDIVTLLEDKQNYSIHIFKNRIYIKKSKK